MTPIIFHIDVNSAYLSWTAVEQLKNGAAVDLREIPAIIGGDQKSRHGVVLAKSPAAKRYGIRTGEPVANAFRKCPNLVMYPPDHRMYREKSRQLMAYLRTFTKEIEQVSVDECYMDFTGIADRYRSPEEGAARIKDGIRERFGFTVNIGIYPRTNCWLRWHRILRSRTGSIRYIRRRSGRKCGRCPSGTSIWRAAPAWKC